MRLRDIAGWPPMLTDSHTHRLDPSHSIPAKLKRCNVFSVAGSANPYLSIVVEYQGRDFHAMIQNVPESLMRQIEATLQGHEGATLMELGRLEIVDVA